MTGEQRPLDLARVASAVGCNDAVQGVLALACDLGAPRSLRELGMVPASLEATVQAIRDDTAAARDTRLRPDVLATLVRDAYHGPSPFDLAPSHPAHSTPNPGRLVNE